MSPGPGRSRGDNDPQTRINVLFVSRSTGLRRSGPQESSGRAEPSVGSGGIERVPEKRSAGRRDVSTGERSDGGVPGFESTPNGSGRSSSVRHLVHQTHTST
ncbi:unnamed protein product [Pleuronectes platessa]|uniref:Uncharacterized protein n=1 Tax=Pleuronectes platessa TaxID=8262 RepID=A0A9N7UG58_PLEPL|nr:unnamed protein product [Pleuronectes platessa]